MLKDLKTAKDKVGELLEKYPETRDCDKMLWLAYMVIYHGLKKQLGENAYLAFKTWFLTSEVPASESIRRVRQKFQESGQYLGTKRKEKLEEEVMVRDWSRREGFEMNGEDDAG